MLIIKTIMNNPDSLIKSLNSLKTENEKKQFVNQKLTTFYLSNDADSLCLIFNNSQFNKMVPILNMPILWQLMVSLTFLAIY